MSSQSSSITKNNPIIQRGTLIGIHDINHHIRNDAYYLAVYMGIQIFISSSVVFSKQLYCSA